jgi:hypothetical protein
MHRVIKGYWQDVDRCKSEIDQITNWQEKGYGKRVSNKDFPPAIGEVIRQATSPEFIREFIGYGLIPDPELRGGGVHSSLPGGYLRMHRDFNYLPGFGYRVSNLLLYLNRDVGGDLLVGGDRIPAEANTMVILSPEDWHGHPEPCTARRDSIALYYYSREKPSGLVERVVTDYEWTETTK